MSKENQRILYEHYIKTNQLERANEILKSYPDFEEPKELVTKEKISDLEPSKQVKRGKKIDG